MKKSLFTKIVVLASLASVSVFAEVNIGSKALDFSLPRLDASKKTATMNEYKNEVILLNFWASWCKGCKKEMPFLQEMAKNNTKKFSVVAVNIDNEEEKAKAYIEKFESKIGETSKIKFLYDKEKSLPKAYELGAVPCSLLIKNGKIIKYYLGSFNSDNEEVLIADVKDALK